MTRRLRPGAVSLCRLLQPPAASKMVRLPSNVAGCDADAQPSAAERRRDWVLAATVLVSSWLLFQVQPMAGKRILPWFGGGPAVWTTAMLFFQAALLAGYLYAHLIVKLLRPRAQAIVHAGLLGGGGRAAGHQRRDRRRRVETRPAASRRTLRHPGDPRRDGRPAVPDARSDGAAGAIVVGAAARAPARPTGSTRCRTSARSRGW